MMKKIIIVLIALMFIPFVFADDNAYGTQIVDMITTPNSINSNINLIAGGDITNNVVCQGNTCTSNIYGGSVNIPENQVFNYNSYTSTVVEGHGGGLSISTLTNNLGVVANDFYYANATRFGGQDSWNLWALLDAMFVSHKEYQSTYNNVIYIANRQDRLEAKINILEDMLNLSNNTVYNKMVDAEETRIYAQRTKDYTCFQDNSCVIVKQVG